MAIPVCLTVKCVLDTEVVYRQALVPGAWVETGMIDVDTHHLLQPAVKMDMQTGLLTEVSGPVFRFPFSCKIVDGQGGLVSQGG